MSASQSTTSIPASCRISIERLGASDESIACLASSKFFWSRALFLAALELALSACGTNFTGARSSASSAARPGGGSTRTSLLASSTLRLVWGTSGASGVDPMSSAEDGTDPGSGAGGSGSAERSAGGSADGSAGVGSAGWPDPAAAASAASRAALRSWPLWILASVLATERCPRRFLSWANRLLRDRFVSGRLRPHQLLSVVVPASLVAGALGSCWE